MRDAAGNEEIIKYYGMAGNRLAMQDDDGFKYLLSDHLGSIVAVLDDLATQMSEQRYTPFGEPRFEAGVTETDLGFTGQRMIAGTGLMDYKARFYDARLGRFTQPDSIVPSYGNPQSLNRFSYVINNPINYVDPSGHSYDCGPNPCPGDPPPPPPCRASYCAPGNGPGPGGDDEDDNDDRDDGDGEDSPGELDEDLRGGGDDCATGDFSCSLYMKHWESYGMAWTILNHRNSSGWERALAAAYLQLLPVDVAAHLALLAGAGGLACSAVVSCLAAAESALGIGTAACADGDCANEISLTLQAAQSVQQQFGGTLSQTTAPGWQVRLNQTYNGREVLFRAMDLSKITELPYWRVTVNGYGGVTSTSVFSNNRLLTHHTLTSNSTNQIFTAINGLLNK